MARSPHPTDRRATLVGLTEAGAVLATTLKRDQDAFAERLFADADPDELHAFMRMVDRVLVQVEERLGPPR